MLINNKM